MATKLTEGDMMLPDEAVRTYAHSRIKLDRKQVIGVGEYNLNEEGLFQDRVRERDLDNFLVEELHSSDMFRHWLVARLDQSFVPPQIGVVRLGKSPQRLQDNRQTDVRMGWFDQQEQLLACILIESKVTADFQQGQAQSYAAELAECRDVLGAQAACAVLVAPAAKFPALVGREVFDDCVSIEEIIAFLQARLETETLPPELASRLEARIGLLEALCGKRPGTWSPITLPEKRAFPSYTRNSLQK